MAKMFYSAQEAAEKLGRSEEEVKTLVREGKLREFRDAGKVNYKVEDVEALAGSLAPAPPKEPSPASPGEESSASASGDILLEPVEDSSVEVSPGASDVVGLEESDASGTSSGTAAAAKSKEDTVVPSVGVNVFDDEELDEHVDPLAQTAVTDVAGLGLEGMGSGSGILDLTRESDDTSLGRELLDEIYTGEGEAEAKEGETPVEMGEDTRAGLEEALPAEAVEEEPAAPTASATTVPAVGETGPAATAAAPTYTAGAVDPVASALTALLVVALAVMWVGGLATAALVRGITPSLLEAIYGNLWLYAAGSVLASLAAAAATFFVVKKRSG